MIVKIEAKAIDITKKSYQKNGETIENEYLKIKQNLETLELRLPEDVHPTLGERYLITANYVRRYNEEKKQFYIFWDVVDVEVVV